MKIVTKIGRGVKVHAAHYNPETGNIALYCNSLKYPSYWASVVDGQPPTKNNVTCKKCLDQFDFVE